MDLVALVLWVLTALGGLTMAGIWLRNRGPNQHRAGISRISTGRLASHFGFAAAGLVLWIVYTASDNAASGWIALAILPVVATLGILMFMTWLAGRGATVTTDQPAEQMFPVALVAGHAVLAVATVLTVFVTLVT